MKEKIKNCISSNLDKNMDYIKELFKDNSDMVYREFEFPCFKAALVYIDGMSNKEVLDDYVLESLMQEERELKDFKEIKDKLITVSEIKEIDDLSEGIKDVLCGETLLLINGFNLACIIGTRSWPARGISEPSGETTIRGSREGFSETIRFNTALVRRRIRDTRLRIKSTVVGVRSKTDLAIMYIDDIVNKRVLRELERRIDRIDIDAILDSGYIEQLIEDDCLSPFPQIQSSERPDVVAAALYEGRIAILVDNSPFAIIVPATLPSLLQSPDDYYQRWISASIVRILRTIAIIMAITFPALYISVTSFHTAIIPTRLAYSIAASREGVPFPAFIEALIMEISFDLLLEAIVRLPRPIGATIGIVGGLIIGQSAVSAGIVSPIMIIIVSITAITEFITPNYGVTTGLRIVRVFLTICSAIVGLYGIMLGLIVVLTHLIKLKSFGIPYLAPVVNSNKRDLKDLFVRLPLKFFKKRPIFIKTKDKTRQE
ncbi:spore germination protein [Clostridium botulinum C]|uniref:Spore germination protein n=1 Tax=Clostridium botulinum C TaxID=36828 RepID=A0A9Q3Z141_CLOBO|nr:MULTISPECIES: spore germination protein [Clostridium]EGO89016.1 spore gernimation protein [Clostridium botulinum C str. Stockholm]KEI11021.1 spore gernimation protein [Clostridium sp. K25]MCD3194983.1 spore germination protein [Clostridium botulinum C]MCD3200782.1 spore germination protein [Clostridium botulinum C]MCD3206190.1 spore germination protein [Clostridium botulinum C]